MQNLGQQRLDVDLADGTSLRESASTSPGYDTVVARVRDVPVGMTVCYDVRFPELYRSLERRGARVITVPSAFTVTAKKPFKIDASGQTVTIVGNSVDLQQG